MRALTMAVNLRKPPLGLLHHSDRGSQYASHAELASQIRTTALSDNLLPEGCGQHPKNGALHEQKTPSQPLA